MDNTDLNLEKIIEDSFTMDTLGIKDKVRATGLSKNFKKPENEWTPQEKEYDLKLKVEKRLNEKGNSFYVVSIPWKNGDKPDLVNNLNGVIARQNRTCSKAALDKKGTSIEEVNAKFQSDLEKGYFFKVDESDINRSDCYYLNWFMVIDRTRATTKMRIVFDAAAKDKYGKSLNSAIAKGPNRLQDLYTILLQFRMYEYAFSADVSEMFLRIKLHEKDQPYHRFYWNEAVWQFSSIIFGECSSPDASQKVLYVNYKAVESIYPLATKAAKEHAFMNEVI